MNDHAGRAIAFIHEYRGLICRDEMQLQLLLHDEEDQHNMYSHSSGMTLSHRRRGNKILM